MDPSTDFFTWLANQPAFLEVAVGAFFCLVIAPALLAGIATAVTMLEGFVETGLLSIPMLNLGPVPIRTRKPSSRHSAAERADLAAEFAVKPHLQKH